MKEDNIVMVVHTLRIPHAIILFGKPFALNLDLVFEHCFVGETGFRFKAKSLTMNTEDGVPYDMMHMLDDDALFVDFIIAKIHENQIGWDKDEDWWS